MSSKKKERNQLGTALTPDARRIIDRFKDRGGQITDTVSAAVRLFGTALPELREMAADKKTKQMREWFVLAGALIAKQEDQKRVEASLPRKRLRPGQPSKGAEKARGA